MTKVLSRLGNAKRMMYGVSYEEAGDGIQATSYSSRVDVQVPPSPSRLLRQVPSL